jgi:hypothetical protein
MQRVSFLTFLLLLIVVGSFIAATTGQLPARVASHFGAGNLPNGWMSREGYLLFMLGFALVFPIVIVAAIGWLPRIAPRSINVPDREYWLDPSRREATLASLATYAYWLGCLLALFIVGVHYAVLVANASVPPRLPADLFWALMIGFLAALALWIGALVLRFRHVR